MIVKLPFVMAMLAVALAVVAWALLAVILWLRRTAARYFFFELFVCIFMLGIGFLFLKAPPETRMPMWVIGIGTFAMGASSLLRLLARRFHWNWMWIPLGGKTIRCSFCNKSQRDVKKLIAGPAVYICDECVDICLTIIREDQNSEPEPESPQPMPAST